MGQSFLHFEQRLLQTTADLHKQIAEIRALREAVRAAGSTQRG